MGGERTREMEKSGEKRKRQVIRENMKLKEKKGIVEQKIWNTKRI